MSEEKHSRGQLRLRKRRRSGLQRTLSLAALAFALLALVLGIRYAWDWHKVGQANDALKGLYHGESSTSPSPGAIALLPQQTPASTPEAAPSPAPTGSPEPVSPSAQDPWPPLRQASGDRFLPLLRHNKDIVGWLSYEPFYQIDFAVVQRDNSFYMDHAVDGKKTWQVRSSWTRKTASAPWTKT